MKKETLNSIDSINNLTSNWIKYLEGSSWYKGPGTYFSEIRSEIDEAEKEFNENKRVYLEDELGDIFFDYMCLLHSISHEGLIDTDKVFERCLLKFQERIGPNGGIGNNWSEVKQKQKVELEKEYLNSL